MQLFVQFEIEPRFALPFEEGSQFVIFTCPRCNDIPIFENYLGSPLSAEFWRKTEGKYFAALYKPGQTLTPNHSEDFLQPFRLAASPDDQTFRRHPHITIGGKPNWLQGEEECICCCGGQMRFLAQISENMPFPKLAGAPSQPDSFSQNDYCLFLGNEVYVFACENQCDAHAIWITLQN